MAKLTLDIKDNVRMDFPSVIASMENIERSCRHLIGKCDNVLDRAHYIGVNMQTQANDSTQFSLARTTDDINIISRELTDLQQSVNRLVEKLKRLERMAGI